MTSSLIVKNLGSKDYLSVWEAMKKFTQERQADTPDELWIVEHHPVFTLGQSGKREHILDAGHIPVIPVDRGGQVTYHGPGQLVIYVLIDLHRLKLGIRSLITALEQSVITLLAHNQITAQTRPDAPGVYVKGEKICSLGLRVRHGRTYHGLALNVKMDLSPFSRINPCGFPGLSVTHMAAFNPEIQTETVMLNLINQLKLKLGYTPSE